MEHLSLIDDLVFELSYRCKEGYPDFSNKDHISLLSEILNEWGLSEVSDKIISALLGEEDEEEKDYGNSTLDRVVSYKNKKGEQKQSKVGNLLRLKDDTDGRKAAERAMPRDKDERQKVLNALGEEGQDSSTGGTAGGEGDEFIEPYDPEKVKQTFTDPKLKQRYKDEEDAADEDYDDRSPSDDDDEELDEGYLMEAAFNSRELAKMKYQPQWLDYIENGKPFQLEPSGEVILDKSNLKMKGNNTDKTLLQVLSGGTLKDFDEFFKKNTRFVPMLKGTNGKLYALTDISKSTFTGQGGASIPTDSAFYEQGICVEYNKAKGMDVTTAMKTANVKPEKYAKYEAHLTDVCSKIVKNLPDLGSSLKQTGDKTYSPSSEWPSSDGTPKTDIFGGTPHRISVKKKGGSQLVSGKGSDAKGLFAGAFAFYEKHDNGKIKPHLQQLIDDIDNSFKSFNTDNEVSKVRGDTVDSYLKWRVPQIESQLQKTDFNFKLKKNQTAIQNHAKAEAIAVGIAPAMGSWNEWFLSDVDKLGEREVMKWFDGYWKSFGKEELQNEVRDIVNAAITNKRLDASFSGLFDDKRFKAWCVFEAASGTYKFTGSPNLNPTDEPVANEILVFGLDGSVSVKTIDLSWAESHAPKVSSVVAFKSSGRNRFTSLRLLVKESFDEFVEHTINNELSLLTEAIELSQEMLNEISISSTISSLKKVAKTLLKNIMNYIQRFYEKTFKKIIQKLKEMANQGLQVLLDFLGVELDGSATVSINF